jgi:predicted NBD/HSP70 family sugar kinase
MGIVTNQKIYRGKGGAGEMGHVVVVPNGNICECGNHGCLEAYISEPALLKEAQEKGVLNTHDNVEKLSELAKQGNQQAIHILFHAGELLGWVLSGLTNVFDTEFIIVGGEGLRSGEFFIDGMKDAFDKNVMPSLKGRTKLIIDSLGDSAWARGAAGLVLQEVFLSPLE